MIQTTKGCKFGGYSEVIIDCKLGNFKDKNAFVFSLNKNKIYEILNPEKDAGDHCKGWVLFLEVMLLLFGIKIFLVMIGIL